MSDDLTDEEQAELGAISKQRVQRRGLLYSDDAAVIEGDDAPAMEARLLGYIRDRDWDSVIACAAALRKLVRR